MSIIVRTLLIVLLLVPPAAAQVFTKDLDWKELRGEPARYAEILRGQPTTARARLARIASEKGLGDAALLNLFDRHELRAARIRVDVRGPNDFTWFGRVDGGYATIVVKGEHLTGNVQSGAESYSFDPVGMGYHVIRQIATEKYPPDDPPPTGVIDEERRVATNQIASTQSRAIAPTASCPPKIRVLAAYTQAALAAQFDLPARIQLAVDETQQIYDNSNLDLQIELAAAVPVNYTEDSSMNKDLKAFRDPNDGEMDEIHGIRAQTAADVVMLISDNNQYCGLASAIKANASKAFAAVYWPCLQAGQFSFAHEIGHLQGARHNPENDPLPWPFIYGHGYRNDDADWRTVMAYDCPSGCPRIPHFANLFVQFGGEPTGIPPLRMDSIALANTASDVADFFIDCANSGDDGANAGSVLGPAQRVYQAGNEMLIALGSTLLKIAGTGGTGQNMFALQYASGTYTSLPGWPYLLGSQNFPSTIADVLYVNGQTLVGLTDGRLVKVNGTGGTGQNMFAINVHSSGFAGVPGYPYYIGSHRFNSGIVDLASPWGSETLISFANGKVLKVSGTGGSGFNLMAITETSSGFDPVPGYPYYLGDIRFQSAVLDMTPIGSQLLFSLASGKFLKTQWTGGTGHNMLAVTETSSGFNGLSGYPYYVGDAKFSAAASDVTVIGGVTFLSLANGKVLKISNGGGTGHNMFAVTETSSGFNGLSGYPYYLGDTKFSAAVTDVIDVSGVTLLGLANGKLLKVNGTGGTGHNMFAVNETPNGFVGLGGYPYYVGSSAYGSAVADLANVGGLVFVSLQNGKMFKAKNAGGSGYNLFAVAQENDTFYSLCCYDYWSGSF